MKYFLFKSVACFLGLVATGVCSVESAKAITLHTEDFIVDSTRTNFNGFEEIQGTFFGHVYEEDGIKVEQMLTDGDDIATTFNEWGAKGFRSWYTNGGDYGYTRITRVNNIDFQNIGLLRGTGWGSTLPNPITYVYELLNNGGLVLSGSVFSTQSPGYLGFSGGGFDEVRLAAYYGDKPTQIIGGYNGLVIDSIELSGDVAPIPTPALLPGLIGIGTAVLRKRKQKTE